MKEAAAAATAATAVVKQTNLLCEFVNDLTAAERAVECAHEVSPHTHTRVLTAFHESVSRQVIL